MTNDETPFPAAALLTTILDNRETLTELLMHVAARAGIASLYRGPFQAFGRTFDREQAQELAETLARICDLMQQTIDATPVWLIPADMDECNYGDVCATHTDEVGS